LILLRAGLPDQLKMLLPAARGRARKFQRKTSHIKVIVDGQQREARKATTKKLETEEKS
jgi:hypothetical protein